MSNDMGLVPSVSVITCTWNSEPYIAQSIDSVLSQNYSNIEYIFVDGGSTDGTLERIASVPREKKIINNVRGGVAHAMNVGVDAATGDIIAHLHADDYYISNNVISKVALIFQDKDVKWLFGRAMSDMNDGRLVPEDWAVPNYSYDRLVKGNFIPHQATFVRREVFMEMGGFNEEYRYAMDYEFWLRIGNHLKPIQLDEHLVAFRRHSGSLTTANYGASMREDFRIRLKYIKKTPIEVVKHLIRFVVRQARYYYKNISFGD